jgi:uncharacterized glyoxalase superfamily protein PhnB/uncharacterized protein YndB with AHSA1/START domain
MEKQNEILNETATRDLVITRVFDAPRELVFKAWTEAERLGQWWGPKGFEVRVVGLDLRPGGTFHYCLRSAGGHEMWGKFVYCDIKAPEQITYVSSFSDEEANVTRAPFSQTWPLEIQNTLTLSEDDGKTTLTLRGAPLNATAEERATFEEAHHSIQQGFSGTFAQLEDYLAKTQTAEKQPQTSTTKTMAKVNPYLNFAGNTEEAFLFYKSVFGGEFLALQRFKDTPEAGKIPENEQDKIMHVALPIGNGNILMATDALESMGQKLTVGNNFSLSVDAESKEEADRLFNKLSEGGKPTMPMEQTFWGAYFGMLTDRFGIQWMVSFDENQKNN